MVQVEEKRLAELLREEWKLNALEAGGVDDWNGYDYSLYPDEEDTYDETAMANKYYNSSVPDNLRTIHTTIINN